MAHVWIGAAAEVGKRDSKRTLGGNLRIIGQSALTVH